MRERISVVIPARAPLDVYPAAAAAYWWADEVVIQGGPGGIALAKNNGARKAHGDVLVFTDDDTVITGGESWVPDSDADLWVASDFSTTTTDKHTTMSCITLAGLVWMRNHLAAVGPFTAVRRAWFDAVGGFQRAWWEDVDFGRRVQEAGGRIGVAPVQVRIDRPFTPLPQLQANYLRDLETPFNLDGPAIVFAPRKVASLTV